LRDSPVEKQDRDLGFITGPEKVGPEFGFGNQEQAGTNSPHRPPDDQRVVEREEKDTRGFLEKGLGRLVSCPGHGCDDDGNVRGFLSEVFKKRKGAYHLADGCGMNPDGPLIRSERAPSHPLKKKRP
jgi:hypothetical protein